MFTPLSVYCYFFKSYCYSFFIYQALIIDAFSHPFLMTGIKLISVILKIWISLTKGRKYICEISRSMCDHPVAPASNTILNTLKTFKDKFLHLGRDWQTWINVHPIQRILVWRRDSNREFCVQQSGDIPTRPGQLYSRKHVKLVQGHGEDHVPRPVSSQVRRGIYHPNSACIHASNLR